MVIKVLGALAIAVTCAANANAVAQPVGPSQAFQLALKKNESVLQQQSRVEIAADNLSIARGSFAPTVAGIGTYLRQEEANGAVASSANPEQSTARITASMPIFRGGAEYAGLGLRNSELEAAESGQQSVNLATYRDVMRAFYGVLGYEKDIQNFVVQIELNKKRASDLNQRVQVGRSRKSEVFSVEASIASIQAQIESTKGLLAAQRERLNTLTGIDASTPLIDTAKLPDRLGPLETFESKALGRPDVVEQKKKQEATDSAITVARAGHFPSIDLDANYYFKRTGILANTNWDAQATLTIPIFAGGATQAAVRQAAANDRIQQLEAGRTFKLAREEIRSAYQAVSSDIAQIESLAKSAEFSEKSYTDLRREYGLGLVTNLDVLQMLNIFQDSRRALDRARLAAKMDYLILLAAVGEYQ